MSSLFSKSGRQRSDKHPFVQIHNLKKTNCDCVPEPTYVSLSESITIRHEAKCNSATGLKIRLKDLERVLDGFDDHRTKGVKRLWLLPVTVSIELAKDMVIELPANLATLGTFSMIHQAFKVTKETARTVRFVYLNVEIRKWKKLFFETKEKWEQMTGKTYNVLPVCDYMDPGTVGLRAKGRLKERILRDLYLQRNPGH